MVRCVEMTNAIVAFGALAALLAIPAAAAPGPTLSPAYPLTARLTVGQEVAKACVSDETGRCVVSIGDRARADYDEVARKMFRPLPEGSAPDLEVTVHAIRIDVVASVGGRSVTVETRALIRARSEGDLGEARSMADSPVLGSDDDSLARAGMRALDESIAGFERAFADDGNVVDWLLARGLEPVGSMVAWPARAEWVTFADVGGGYLNGVGDGATNGFVGRFGIEGKWFVLQGIIGRWSTSFDTRLEPADLTAMDLGVEAGSVYRVSRSIELRGGLGLHGLWGSAASPAGPFTLLVPEQSFGEVVPSLFAAVQSSWWPSRRGNRVRGGLEVRRFLATTEGFPDLGRKVPIANLYVGAFIGFEWAWDRKAKVGAR